MVEDVDDVSLMVYLVRVVAGEDAKLSMTEAEVVQRQYHALLECEGPPLS